MTTGTVLAGVALLSAAAYGVKKAMDSKKVDKAEENESQS